MKRIKNSIALLLFILLPVTGYSQESAAQKWVHSFEGKSGITMVSISPAMFRMLSKIKSTDPEYQQITRFASKLREFKIILADGDDKSAKAVAAKNEFNRLIAHVPLHQYEELMSVNEGTNKIVFRVIEQNDRIQELLMTISGSDQIVMFIKGDFKLNELTEISDDLNISGMNKIQKLKK